MPGSCFDDQSDSETTVSGSDVEGIEPPSEAWPESLMERFMNWIDAGHTLLLEVKDVHGRGTPHSSRQHRTLYRRLKQVHAIAKEMLANEGKVLEAGDATEERTRSPDVQPSGKDPPIDTSTAKGRIDSSSGNAHFYTQHFDLKAPVPPLRDWVRDLPNQDPGRFPRAIIDAALSDIDDSLLAFRQAPPGAETLIASVTRERNKWHRNTKLPARMRQYIETYFAHGVPAMSDADLFAILWYSAQLKDADGKDHVHQLYAVCNQICRDLGAVRVPPPKLRQEWALYRPFVVHVDRAIQRLPSSEVVLFRGLTFSLPDYFQTGRRIVWGGFSSLTLDRDQAKAFLGGMQVTKGTYCMVLSQSAKAVFFASVFPEEMEFLHSANLELEVCSAVPASILQMLSLNFNIITFKSGSAALPLHLHLNALSQIGFIYDNLLQNYVPPLAKRYRSSVTQVPLDEEVTALLRSQNSVLLIAAQAGMGKTTCALHLAKDCERDGWVWLFVSLPSVKRDGRATVFDPNGIVDYLQSAFGFADGAMAELRLRNVVLVLDSLDEVDHRDEPPARTWMALNAFEEWQSVKLIVTCRVEAMHKFGNCMGHDFQSLFLLPFNHRQMAQYVDCRIRQMHAGSRAQRGDAATPEDREAPEEAAECAGPSPETTEVLGIIQGCPIAKVLANPFQLFMAMDLHCQNRRDADTFRSEGHLYEQWIRGWFCLKGHAAAQIPECVAYAGALAWTLHRRGMTHGTVGALCEDRLFRSCPLRVANFTPEATYSFRHKSLQEYLVAHYLLHHIRRRSVKSLGEIQLHEDQQVRRYFRQIYRMLKGGGEDLTGVREALLRTLEASHNGARAQALRAANSITLLGDVLEGAEEHAALQATLQAIQKRHTHRSAVWALLASWRREQRLWLTAPVTGLDVRSVSDGVGAHYQRAFELQMMMQDEMTHDEPLVRLLLASIRDGKAYLPILMQVGNRALQKKHWAQILTRLQAPFSADDPFTLQDLWACHIAEHKGLVDEQSAAATKEQDLATSLSRAGEACQALEVQTHPLRGAAGDWYTVSGWEAVTAGLEDNLMTARACRASPLLTETMRPRADALIERLELMQRVVAEWQAVQSHWMALHEFFDMAVIQRQCPAEAKAFAGAAAQLCTLNARARYTANVAQLSAPAGLPALLQDARCVMEASRAFHDSFLEDKQRASPRLWCVSSTDLYALLDGDVRPVVGLFPDVHDLMSEPAADVGSPEAIRGVRSKIGETVTFVDAVQCKGEALDSWTNCLEDAIRQTVRQQVVAAVEAHATMPRPLWYWSFPLQCVLVATAIGYVQTMEAAFANAAADPGALAAACGTLQNRFEEVVDRTRTGLTALQRRVLYALINVLGDHAARAKASRAEGATAESFQWVSQARYRLHEGAVFLDLGSVSLAHGYEYNDGSGALLVRTPVTGRAWLALAQAVQSGMGVGMVGPAGTGKTETAKGLAQLAGRPFFVVNAHDGMALAVLSRLTAAAAQMGGWVIFDQFNRIAIDVLFPFAALATAVYSALRARQALLWFDGRRLPLKASFGLFATINPGCAGGTEVPEALKAVLRPCAMVLPDYEVVAKYNLYCEGYRRAAALARGLVQVLRMSAVQLSRQHHYDFGMRAVKACCKVAGQQRQAAPGEDEAAQVVQALRRQWLPILVDADVAVFGEILRSCFPGVRVAEAAQGTALETVLRRALDRHGRAAPPDFVAKLVALHNTLLVRHGLVLVGPSMSGKTEAWRAVARAFPELHAADAGRGVAACAINPSAVACAELYGRSDPATGAWRDGLLAHRVRQGVASADTATWIVLDGSPDPSWASGLMTMLDDNKCLTLWTGEALKMPSTMRIILETDSTALATPALISRCGVLSLEPSHLEGWRTIARCRGEALAGTYGGRWLQGRAWEVLTEHCDPVLAFVRANTKEDIATVEAQRVESLLIMVASFLASEDEDESGSPRSLDAVVRARRSSGPAASPLTSACGSPASEPADGSGRSADRARVFDAYLALSFVWSLCGNVVAADRAKCHAALLPVVQAVCDAFPEEHTVYDWCFRPESMSFARWTELLPPLGELSAATDSRAFVPTVETVIFHTLLTNLLRVDRGVLINGPTGGKTTAVSALLPTLAHAAFHFKMGLRTSSGDLQRWIEARMHWISEDVLAGPQGRRTLIFVDDVNLPALERSGTCPSIELLRQIRGDGGFYDCDRLHWRTIQGLSLIAACAPPGGCRSVLPTRLVSRFHCLASAPLGPASLNRVFQVVNGGHFANFAPEVAGLVTAMVRATIGVYEALIDAMRPTPLKPHYTYSVHQIKRVFQGMHSVQPAHCSTADSLLRLWIHECTRVFHDPLCADEDRRWWWRALPPLVEQHFATAWAPGYERLVFCDFLDRTSASTTYYREAEALGPIYDTLTGVLASYNMHVTASHQQLNMILLEEAVLHLIKVARVLRLPGGSALLVGEPGSGCRLFTRLAAFMKGLELREIRAVSSGYALAEFRRDLKAAAMEAGCHDREVVVFMEETHIVEEAFLSDINNFLTTAQLAGGLQPDDVNLVTTLFGAMDRKSGQTEPSAGDAYLARFEERCRRNVHVVLALQPSSAQLRARFRTFPALSQLVNIVWLEPWSRPALLRVAEHVLGAVEAEAPEFIAVACRVCAAMHASVRGKAAEFSQALRRPVYTTNRHFLRLLDTYVRLLDERGKAMDAQQEKYRQGLNQLTALEMVAQGTAGAPGPGGADGRWERAAALVRALAPEKSRWEARLRTVGLARQRLKGDMLLAAGAVAYLGPFDHVYRRDLLRDWARQCGELGVQVEEAFDLRALVDPLAVVEWGRHGLPTDRTSRDNAVLLTQSSSWSLAIDPQQQARLWIMNMERGSGLQVARASDPDMPAALRRSIETGLPFLLEGDAEAVPVALHGLLKKRVYETLGRVMVQLGDTAVDYHPGFRLYLTTTAANPHCTAALQGYLSLVNFAVGPEALEDQLLGAVVRHETGAADEAEPHDPGLRQELRELEDTMLSLLATRVGEMVEDEAVAHALAHTQQTYEETQRQADVLQAVAAEAEAAAEEYRPVARRGALMYRALAKMTALDHMYHGSVQLFARLFRKALQGLGPPAGGAERVPALVAGATARVHAVVSRGLHEPDRALLAVLLAVEVLAREGAISGPVWGFFLRPDGGEGDGAGHPPWLSRRQWAQLRALGALAGFEGVDRAVAGRPREWEAWAQAECPPAAPAPGGLGLGVWQRVVLSRVLRPGSLALGLRQLVLEVLGPAVLQPPAVPLAELFRYSAAAVPIVFVMAAGSDCRAAFEAFAREKAMADRVTLMDMEQFLGPGAAALPAAMGAGHWVFLQNCESSPAGLPVLERAVADLQSSRAVHRDFRLFCSVLHTAQFPIGILRLSLRYPDEPPRGVRGALLQRFAALAPDELWNARSAREKQLIFAVVLCHAIADQRRRFGPLGWVAVGEFRCEDAASGARAALMHLESLRRQSPQWDQQRGSEDGLNALRYVLGELVLGGHLTDHIDRRTLNTLLAHLLRPECLAGGYEWAPARQYYPPGPVEGCDLDRLRAHVSQLPADDPPAALGLGANGARVVWQRESQRLAQALVAVQPKASEHVESAAFVAAKAKDFLARLPDPLDGSVQVPEGAAGPLSRALRSQTEFLNRLLEAIRASLQRLLRVLEGLAAAAPDTDAMLEDLWYGRVPDAWRRVAYASLKPLGAWFHDLLQRCRVSAAWARGPPASYWLGAFAFPQQLIEGAMRAHAQRAQVEANDLQTHVEVLAQRPEEVARGPDAGIYLHGLFLEGARWDARAAALAEPQEHALHQEMPVMHLRFAAQAPPPDRYGCPVYRTSARVGTLDVTGHSTNFITTLALPSPPDCRPDHWCLRGVALLSMLDD